jgi:hypothetical protein
VRYSDRVPRVSGRTAAISAAVGSAFWAGGITISITANQVLGFVIGFAGLMITVGLVTIWAMGRYGILDSMVKYRQWMDTAPKRRPPAS